MDPCSSGMPLILEASLTTIIVIVIVGSAFAVLAYFLNK